MIVSVVGGRQMGPPPSAEAPLLPVGRPLRRQRGPASRQWSPLGEQLLNLKDGSFRLPTTALSQKLSVSLPSL